MALKAVKLSLKFATAKKLRQLKALEQNYRFTVNHFIGELWLNPTGKIYKDIQPPPSIRLTRTTVSNVAFCQARQLVLANKANNRPIPVYRGGLQLVGLKFETKAKSFDYFVSCYSATAKQRIHLPVKSHKVLNKWLSVPGAELKDNGTIKGKNLIVWVKTPDLPLKTEGKVIGVDIGINKLLVDSDGKEYGKDIKRICAKIQRRKNGSKNKAQSRKQRTYYINESVNRLPWRDIKAIGVEDLTGLKTGKKYKQSKNFRKKLAPWTYRQVITKIGQNACLNRVQTVSVDPAYTSQSCPICSTRSKDNRKGESFKCVSCGYAADADLVGALNVRNKVLKTLVPVLETSGSVNSPDLQKSTIKKGG